MAQNPVSVSTETTPVKATSGKEIGTTTIGASGAASVGAGLGYAVGKIIVFILLTVGIDVSPIEEPIIFVCSALIAGLSGIIGGKFSPTNKANETVVTETVRVLIPDTATDPSGSTAKHRADVPLN